jgi:GrpB-like predicted nucleotidyltransferase (UPF0157 family)
VDCGQLIHDCGSWTLDREALADRQVELDRITVGGAHRHDATVHLEPYDPRWPELYRREEARIRRTLGERVLRLEHAGSTSVPGLAAKPVIDILLVVQDSADEPAYVPDMASAGYRLLIREPEWQEHRLFKGPDTNINLHTFSPGAAEIERMVVFRDRLRAHHEERELYEATKRQLAEQVWAFMQDYADAKTVVVEAILARAFAEAGKASPGPPRV